MMHISFAVMITSTLGLILLSNYATMALLARRDSCYPHVGCFSNQLPWISASRAALPPQNPKDITTITMFYNKDVPDGVAFPTFPKIDISGIPFDNNKTTVVIYHCYLGNSTASWLLRIKDAFINRGSANVIISNWDMPKKNLPQAANDARVIGKLVAMTLQAAEIDPSKLHLIGFCVGAHSASYTAKIIAKSGKKVSRVTGLSPNWRLFDNEPSGVRLTAADGELVDVHYTDMDGAGSAQLSGHLNFFYNGGFHQPGCGPSDRLAVKSCSHSAAHEYFAEAVESECLAGEPAQVARGDRGEVTQVNLFDGQNTPRIPIGMNTPKLARGNFFVTTNPAPVFCTAATP